MLQTQNIHSLTDFQRNTADHIKRLKESGLPEVLTVNGRAELVLQTADAYQALLNRLELHESAAAATRRLQDLKDGPAKPLAQIDRMLGPKLPGSEGEHQAQKKYGTTRRALTFYNKQMLGYINPLMREFIARQEMVFVATSDAHGECDCSFRSGLPGFVHVLDDKTLTYPEYRGNGVMASIGNIFENPHLGLVFIDFFHSTVGLHVNGKAQVLDNQDLLVRPDLPPAIIEAIQTKSGRVPERWILVKVAEAYIHCSKHIPLLQKLDKKIHWGTDNASHKGGDYFKAQERILANERNA